MEKVESKKLECHGVNVVARPKDYEDMIDKADLISDPKKKRAYLARWRNKMMG